MSLWLFAAMLLAAGAGSAVWFVLPGYREQQVIPRIEEWGGFVDKETVVPEWLRELVGEDQLKKFKVFERVTLVDLHGTEITDAEIAHLSGLANLKWLSLSGTKVSDAGLVHLRGLANLHYLALFGTKKVTDTGLEHLSNLTDLTHLGLDGTKVTDGGLVHLIKLTSLTDLGLDFTGVTENGVGELQRALPNCNISHRFPVGRRSM